MKFLKWKCHAPFDIMGEDIVYSIMKVIVFRYDMYNVAVSSNTHGNHF